MKAPVQIKRASPFSLTLAMALAMALLGGAAALVQIAGPSTALAQPAAAGPTVRIDNFTFNPATITVKVGTTVTWINADDIPHTVRANDNTFKSKVLDTDEKFSFTFTKSGEFPYFCSLHPHMTGKVVVNP